MQGKHPRVTRWLYCFLLGFEYVPPEIEAGLGHVAFEAYDASRDGKAGLLDPHVRAIERFG